MLAERTGAAVVTGMYTLSPLPGTTPPDQLAAVFQSLGLPGAPPSQRLVGEKTCTVPLLAVPPEVRA